MTAARKEELKQYQRAYQLKNKERIQAQKKVYHLKNQEKFNRKCREWWSRNKIHTWLSGLNRRYGITKEEVYDLIVKQDGRCAVCKKELMRSTAKLDHNHKSGKVRGFLCSQCNVGIGMFKEKIAVISQVKYYLESNDGGSNL